jgi:hypothetical protein
VSERGEEAGEQSLDLMDKNCVRRRGAPGELASDSKARKRIKAALRKRSKGQGKAIAPYPGRSVLSAGRAGVSRGHSSRWGNVHPWWSGKPGYRAKGRTVRELSGKAKGDGWAVEIWQDQTGRGSSAEGVR